MLIVIDGTSRDVPDHVGLGWRKRDSAGRATGWWQTSHGLMMDQHIKYWMETPALPNTVVTNFGAQKTNQHEQH